MLDGTIGVVEGSRYLDSLSFEAEFDNDEIFNIFIGIVSETDTFPLGNVRQQWNKDALKLKDQEQTAYEKRMKNRVMEACKKLLGNRQQ